MASTPPEPPGTRISGTPGLGRGRSLQATRRFAPGELIASFSSPLIALPDGERMRIMCNYCLRRPIDLKACTGCQCVVYCDAACQRAHWRGGHKRECAVFQRVRSRAGKDRLPTAVRAVLQVMLRPKADGVVAQAFGPGGWLEGNVEGFKRDSKVWDDIELQSLAAAVYGGLSTEAGVLETVREVFCKVSLAAGVA